MVASCSTLCHQSWIWAYLWVLPAPCVKRHRGMPLNMKKAIFCELARSLRLLQFFKWTTSHPKLVHRTLSWLIDFKWTILLQPGHSSSINWINYLESAMNDIVEIHIFLLFKGKKILVSELFYNVVKSLLDEIDHMVVSGVLLASL